MKWSSESEGLNSGHFCLRSDRDCVREPLCQHEMLLHCVGIGDKTGSAGTEVLSKGLEELLGQMEDNAMEQLGLHDFGTY